MIELFFAGLWAIVWKYVLAIGLGGCLLVVAFVPIVWIPMWVRKVALWGGSLICACTIAYSVGIRDEHRHGVAQWNVMVDKEIESAEKDRIAADASVDRSGDDGMRYDRHNRDNRDNRAGHQ